MRYNIYAGLGGGFGGYVYQYTDEFETENDAIDAAYDMAVEEYQSNEGLHGLGSWGDIKDEYCEDNGIDEDSLTDEDYEIIDAQYQEEMEGWLSYRVTTVEKDPNHDKCYRW